MSTTETIPMPLYELPKKTKSIYDKNEIHVLADKITRTQLMKSWGPTDKCLKWYCNV